MKNFIILIILSFVLSSCAVTHLHSFGADKMRSRSYIELKLNDIDYLGETEISYEYSRYLFIGTRLIAINGEQPDNSVIHYVTLPSTVGWVGTLFSVFEVNPKHNGMKRALYKVFTDFPDADYVEVTSRSVETHQMFLGRKIKQTATVKAYKYRFLHN